MVKPAGSLPADTTRKFAQWISGLRFNDLPAEVVDAAKRQILDTVAVAWAGSSADGVDDVRQVVLTCAATRLGVVLWDKLPLRSCVYELLLALPHFDTLLERCQTSNTMELFAAALALADARGASGTIDYGLVAGGE